MSLSTPVWSSGAAHLVYDRSVSAAADSKKKATKTLSAPPPPPAGSTTPSLVPNSKKARKGIKALVLDGDRVHLTNSFAEIEAAHKAEKRFWLELDEKEETANNFLINTLKIHPLAVEDIWNDVGIPKVEEFQGYVQLVMHGVREEDVGGSDIPLSLTELDMVIGQNWLVTHAHDEQVCAIAPVIQEIQRNAKLLQKGPAWVGHAILDRMVDEYLPVVNRFESQIEDVEARILEGGGNITRSKRSDHAIMRQILRIKRSLQMLRRTTISQREVLLRLARAEFSVIPKESSPFYRDIYDHFARVTDMVDGYRELATGLLEAHFSIQSQQMNEIMKRLTLISTIMLPLTLIAGIYGMNFHKVFPELEWEYGYFYALGLMVVVAASIILWFKKKRWL